MYMCLVIYIFMYIYIPASACNRENISLYWELRRKLGPKREDFSFPLGSYLIISSFISKLLLQLL